MKNLHIGPGRDKLPGRWDTLDIRPGGTFQADAAGPLPIESNTYDLIYASHIIEHIPWWQTIDALREWHRVLKVGGKLEIWTVDAAKIARRLLAAEENDDKWLPDRWRFRNHEANPYRWAAGRMFAHDKYAPFSWHKALFTHKYLSQCLEKAGFEQHYFLDRSRVRGKDHGWINLGICGVKTFDSNLCKGSELVRDPEATPPAQRSTPPSSEHQSHELRGAWSDALLVPA